MKHPSSRQFFGYWDTQRGDARAPDRSAIEPGALREWLGDIFVLSTDAGAGFPFRVAGTRVCALKGRDLKGCGFAKLFAPASRREIEDVLGYVADEILPVVAGVTAEGPAQMPVHLELLLLPFSARAHTPLSLTGLLAPLGAAPGVVGALQLSSWRTIGAPPRRFSVRALRKLSVARGLTVYEGLR
jgi:hypothetical protein